ncbi:MAG: hypothetical protein JWM10_1787, partial [Myxococcaceae bacterium]|nr:hypothetical protein [Myxococcaceae bacterium]
MSARVGSVFSVALAAVALGCAPADDVTQVDAGRLDARVTNDLAGDRAGAV